MEAKQTTAPFEWEQPIFPARRTMTPPSIFCSETSSIAEKRASDAGVKHTKVTSMEGFVSISIAYCWALSAWSMQAAKANLSPFSCALDDTVTPKKAAAETIPRNNL